MNDILQSRFIRKSDPFNQNFIFKLPQVWWSRAYEYEWASQFSHPTDIALDAACGIEHPLKFYLLDKCSKTYACDLDDRILSEPEMLKCIIDAYGKDSDKLFSKRYSTDITYDISDLTSLPYPDKLFDRIYCISVLEHLNDKFNKFRWLPHIPFFTKMFPNDMEKSLMEFRRILKDDGLIVLTFDHPRINLEYFQYLLNKLDIEFAGGVDFSIPEDALYSEENGLRCVRAILKKHIG